MNDVTAPVPRITPQEAKEMIAQGNALVVDVREAHELVRSGKIAGALHVPCGALEFRADPRDSDITTTDLTNTKRSSCTARSANARRCAAKCLKRWDTRSVYNLGGFYEWVGSGGSIETVEP